MIVNNSIVWRNIEKKNRDEIANHIWCLAKNVDNAKCLAKEISESFEDNSMMSVHVSKSYQYYFIDDPKDSYMFGLFGNWYISLVLYH